jgi:DNA-binding transcriptional ArsR family regulator
VDVAIKAIAEPRRREIVRLVLEEERLAGDIAGHFPEVTGPAISQHLKVLLDAGLVTVRRDGPRRWYRARPEGLRGLQEYLEEFWRTSLATLAREAEREERRKRHGRDSKRS